ncbi:MAG TPA: hypothetical protein VGF97_19315 [Rhizomicrobium sp.]|jgi:hypothetical protein
MTNEQATLVNFVARGKSSDQWKMVLVEQGPWNGSTQVNLKRIQTRLYDCIDATIDGQLAQKFPETRGKKIIIQLDCYNLPKAEISEFFDKFSGDVFSQPDYRDALTKNAFVKSIVFEINFDSIH